MTPMPQLSSLSLCLDISEKTLENALKELLAQAGIVIAEKEDNSQVLLHDSSEAQQEKPSPTLNILNFSRPIKFSELLSHIENLPYQKDVKFAHFSLEIRDKNLKNLKTNQAQRLTEKEVQLLLCLSSSLGCDVPKSKLLSEVWGYHPDTETHTLETHIYRLRQKLENDPNEPEVLLNGPEGYFIKD